MLVDIYSVELHLRMMDSFGLPELTPSEEPELVGPYHFEGQTHFWHYNPRHNVWSVLSEEDPREKLAPHLEGEARRTLVDRFEALHWLPRPQSCSTPSELTPGETFVFSGWRFAWFWIPELGRWELAERGRA